MAACPCCPRRWFRIRVPDGVSGGLKPRRRTASETPRKPTYAMSAEFGGSQTPIKLSAQLDRKLALCGIGNTSEPDPRNGSEIPSATVRSRTGSETYRNLIQGASDQVPFVQRLTA